MCNKHSNNHAIFLGLLSNIPLEILSLCKVTSWGENVGWISIFKFLQRYNLGIICDLLHYETMTIGWIIL